MKLPVANHTVAHDIENRIAAYDCKTEHFISAFFSNRAHRKGQTTHKNNCNLYILLNMLSYYEEINRDRRRDMEAIREGGSSRIRAIWCDNKGDRRSGKGMGREKGEEQ